MLMANIHELFDRAVSYHQHGKLALAEPLYRQVLQAEPRHADALHLLVRWPIRPARTRPLRR